MLLSVLGAVYPAAASAAVTEALSADNGHTAAVAVDAITWQ